jgi:hypothetical protein
LHTPAQIGLIWPNGKRGSGSETASAGQNLERCPTEPSTPVAGQVEQKEEEGGRGRQKSSGQRLYVSQRKERKSRDAYLGAKTGHLRNPSERAEGIMNEGLYKPTGRKSRSWSVSPAEEHPRRACWILQNTDLANLQN